MHPDRDNVTPIDGSKLLSLPGMKDTQANALRAVDRIIEDLQKDSPVPDRTVIRWTSVHPTNKVEFYYVAIFAGGAWYTSAPSDNQNVQRIMQHDDLIAYFNKKKNNLKDIEIAVDFVGLNW